MKILIFVSITLFISCLSDKTPVVPITKDKPTKEKEIGINDSSLSKIAPDTIVPPPKTNSSHELVPLKDGFFSQRCEVSYQKHSLKAETIFYADTAIVEEIYYIDRPIVLKQELSFWRNGKLLKTIKPPFNYRKVRGKSGKIRKALEGVVFSIILLDAYPIPIYDISGYGGENSLTTPQWMAIYDVTGKELYYHFLNHGNTVVERGGDLHELLKKLNLKHRWQSMGDCELYG